MIKYKVTLKYTTVRNWGFRKGTNDEHNVVLATTLDQKEAESIAKESDEIISNLLSTRLNDLKNNNEKFLRLLSRSNGYKIIISSSEVSKVYKSYESLKSLKNE
jgi:uncharacterized protein YdcH (DUF465 family)